LPIVGEEVNPGGETEDVFGDPVLETTGPDPLALLRALLSGG
jgi:hypothetical protein